MATGSGEIKPFISAHSTARKAITWTIVSIVFAIASIPLDIIDSQQTDSDDLSFPLAIIYIVVGIGLVCTIIVSIILFLLWFYRVYRNLKSLGAKELEFSPRMAVVYFFVPILWWWKPYEAMGEIWKVSESGESSRLQRNQMASPQVVKLWWAFWLVSSIVGWMIFRRGFADDGAVSAWLYVGSSVLDIISAYMTVKIIRLIDNMQEKRGSVVLSPVPPGAPSPSVNETIDRTEYTELDPGQDFENQKPRE